MLFVEQFLLVDPLDGRQQYLLINLIFRELLAPRAHLRLLLFQSFSFHLCCLRSSDGPFLEVSSTKEARHETTLHRLVNYRASFLLLD